jgi:hypothetical protein
VRFGRYLRPKELQAEDDLLNGQREYAYVLICMYSDMYEFSSCIRYVCIQIGMYSVRYVFRYGKVVFSC